MAKAADIYFQVNPWKIIEDGFDPSYSRVSESIFSLANETMGIRGCFDEGGSVDSLRGAYTNGVYDFAPVARSYRGIIDHTHFMIPTADWLHACRYPDAFIRLENSLRKRTASDFHPLP